MNRASPIGVKALACCCLLLSLVAGGCSDTTSSGAGSVADFYRTHPLEIIVGFAPGGGYDSSARMIALHMGKHIPGNPKIIVRNMPGAGSVAAANTLNNVGPKDGSAIGIFSDTVPFTPIWDTSRTQFDPRKLGWIGSLTSRGVAMVLVRSDSPAVTLEQARKTTVTVGATGPDSSTSSYARLANELLGTKLKVVLGYAGSSDIYLAMERGEVHGRASSSFDFLRKQKPKWFETNFVRGLVIMSTKSDPKLKDVPRALDLAKTEEDRQVMQLVFGTQQFARTFLAPDGVPPERLEALRKAFRDMMNDPEFLGYAKTHFLEEVAPSYPDAIMAFVNEAYAYPQSVRDRAAHYIGSDD